MADAVETLGRRFEVLRPHLNELQRRLWLGVEAAQLGSGGVAVVAAATKVALGGRSRTAAVGASVPRHTTRDWSRRWRR